MSNNKNNNVILIILIAFLGIQFILRSKVNSNQNVITNNFIEESKEYIRNIDLNGERTVVVLGNERMFDNEGKIVPYHNKAVIYPLIDKLVEEDYTVLTMALPCLEPRCNKDFFNLGQMIVELDPEAVVFHAISGGENTDILDDAFSKSEIPVFLFGRDLPINYELYVGPDNKDLGLNAVKEIKKTAKPEESVVYVETVRLINGDIGDNGFDRINPIKKELTALGLKEEATLFTFWSKTNTYNELVKIFRSGKRVDWIITPSLETAEGAVEAVKTTMPNYKVKIVALDFNPEVRKLLETGQIEIVVGQELYKQSKAISNAIINKESPYTNAKDLKLFASEPITRDNLNTFKNENNKYNY